MTVQDDRMWADVLEAHTPNAAEMAEAEAGLQDLGEVAPLPAADVEALVQLATKTPLVTLESRGVVGTVSRARRFRQPILRAAAAVMLLMAVAWVARQMILSEERHADDNLDYRGAVLLATEPGRSDRAYVSAMFRIVAECGKAADTLRYLADQVEYPVLAEKARLISAELLALLENDPSVPYEGIDGSLVESANTAADTRVAVDLRGKALDRVKELTKSGLTAMLLSPLAGDDAKDQRAASIKRFKHVLPH